MAPDCEAHYQSIILWRKHQSVLVVMQVGQICSMSPQTINLAFVLDLKKSSMHLGNLLQDDGGGMSAVLPLCN